MPIRSKTLFATLLLTLALGGRRASSSLFDDVARFVAHPVGAPATGAASVIDARRAWVGLAYTGDGGASWTGWQVPSTPDVDFDLGVPPIAANTYFVTAERGWLTGTNSVWATDDGASTWRREMPGHLHAVALIGDDGWLAAGDGKSVRNYTTKDAGRTWKQCGPPWEPSEAAPLSSASFLDSTHGWATIGSFNKRDLPYLGGVAKTLDGGCTWKVIWRDSDNPGENLGDIRFVNANIGWLFSYYGKLLETMDGGAHWRTVQLPDDIRLEGAYLESPAKGWVLGSAAGSSGIYYTSDGGVQWHPIPVAEIRNNSGAAREIPPKWSSGFLRILQLRR